MKTLPDIDQMLHRHFPHSCETSLKEAAGDLDIIYSISVGWQNAEHADQPIQADLRAMQEASKKLAQAEQLIRGVGSVGGAFLLEAAHNLESFIDDQFADHRPGKLQSIEIVANNIALLKEMVTDAVTVALGSKNGFSSVSGKLGAPRKRSAYILTLALYDTFKALTGKVPTVPTDRVTNEKYGPFLAFVSDAFAHFEIDASPVNMARQACREKNRKKG